MTILESYRLPVEFLFLRPLTTRRAFRRFFGNESNTLDTLGERRRMNDTRRASCLSKPNLLLPGESLPPLLLAFFFGALTKEAASGKVRMDFGA